LTVHARVRYAERFLQGGGDLVGALRVAGWSERRVLKVLEKVYAHHLAIFAEEFERALTRFRARPERAKNFVVCVAGADVAVRYGRVGVTTLPARRRVSNLGMRRAPGVDIRGGRRPERQNASGS
jgi:hypothetical protein